MTGAGSNRQRVMWATRDVV